MQAVRSAITAVDPVMRETVRDLPVSRPMSDALHRWPPRSPRLVVGIEGIRTGLRRSGHMSREVHHRKAVRTTGRIRRGSQRASRTRPGGARLRGPRDLSGSNCSPCSVLIASSTRGTAGEASDGRRPIQIIESQVRFTQQKCSTLKIQMARFRRSWTARARYRGDANEHDPERCPGSDGVWASRGPHEVEGIRRCGALELCERALGHRSPAVARSAFTTGSREMKQSMHGPSSACRWRSSSMTPTASAPLTRAACLARSWRNSIASNSSTNVSASSTNTVVSWSEGWRPTQAESHRHHPLGLIGLGAERHGVVQVRTDLRGGSVGGVDQLLGGRPHRAERVVTEVKSLHPWGCKMVVREHIDMFS